jgi:hypothetical protein
MQESKRNLALFPLKISCVISYLKAELRAKVLEPFSLSETLVLNRN